LEDGGEGTKKKFGKGRLHLNKEKQLWRGGKGTHVIIVMTEKKRNRKQKWGGEREPAKIRRRVQNF